MKLKSFTLLSVIAIVVVLVSCGGNTQNNSDQQVAELQSQVAELQQQVKNQQGQGNQVPNQQQNQQQNQVPQTQTNVQNQQFGQQGNGQGQMQNGQQSGNLNLNITMDQAKQIATSNAGVDVNSVTYIKTIQDYDNGFMKWEIDFVANNMKYEYDISASNGTILKAEREGVAFGGYVPPANSGQQGNVGGQQNATGQQGFGGQQNMGGQGQGINVEQAKSIAVQHAGFNMSNVTFVKQQYDFDDGIAKWEIEFVNGTNKYEYEIAASNGSVFKFKVESIYND